MSNHGSEHHHRLKLDWKKLLGQKTPLSNNLSTEKSIPRFGKAAPTPPSSGLNAEQLVSELGKATVGDDGCIGRYDLVMHPSVTNVS